MKVDVGLGLSIDGVDEIARRAQASGYDSIFATETTHDPFVPLGIAATATDRIGVATGIAVAFARNPMNLAVSANDIQLLSKGRFRLGLGSQIQPHITKRFSMPWSQPAARMRELILAIRAIWEAFDNTGSLSFRGEFYTHTLLTPFFNPGPNPYGHPEIMLAAVGEQMTQVAGEVADGLLAHPFTTARYVEEVSLPALLVGAARAGKTRSDLTIALPGFVISGADDEAIAANREIAKSQIAFYGSTPAYKGVLDLHGWGDLQPELAELSKHDRWDEMSALIDDDVLDAFAITCSVDEVAASVKARFGHLVDRFSFYLDVVPPDRVTSVIDQLHA